jgi:hypothetical protein
MNGELMGRRTFLVKGAMMAGAVALPEFFRSRVFGEPEPPYRLAPQSVLPVDVRRAAQRVQEAYRFAMANRETLSYIPCYCGCGAEGHTSNASCYLKDSSTPGNLIFDHMSLN